MSARHPEEAPEDSDVYTMQQAANKLQVCERTVWAITNCGDLPYITVGRCKRILKSDLAVYMRRRRVCRMKEGT